MEREQQGHDGKDIHRCDIVIWMNQPSHYQTVFFRELASRPDVTLQVFYGTGLPSARRELGWSSFAEEVFPQRILGGRLDAMREAWRNRRAVHMINGLWSVPAFVLVSLLLWLVGARFYFHSERPNPAKERRGLWREIKRIWIRVMFLRARGIFVIGRAATEAFVDMGVPSKKVVPFLYFTNPGPPRLENPRVFTVCYVGQFVARKRVEDLLAAFARLRLSNPDARLILIGAGPLRGSYEAFVEQHLLHEAVSIAGALPPEQVKESIRTASVLVLPSEFDGWGLTVNEALQSGVPVVCSDGCGAAELLEDHPEWGAVFSRGDVDTLTRLLERIAEGSLATNIDLNEVEAVIGPRAVTDRFLEVIRSGSGVLRDRKA